jgi:hypothetical protein
MQPRQSFTSDGAQPKKNITAVCDRCFDCCSAWTGATLALLSSEYAVNRYAAWQYCKNPSATDNFSCMGSEHLVSTFTYTTGALCFAGISACFFKKMLKKD